MSTKNMKLTCALAGLLASSAASAVTYTDNFSGATSTLKWVALNDACLTAGDGTGSIPKCSSSMITNPDATGYGALRLTPAQNNQTGAILSNFTFPSNQGLQVTFTTYTYGGSADGSAKNGADGISFLLTDGSATMPTVAGGLGGSMGYSCSNGNDTYDGLANAYLGLGVDEFGNFLNSGDNTSSGIYNTNNTTSGTTANGSNTFAQSTANNSIGAGTGAQYQPERIGLRGAGNTNFAWLNSQNSSYYSTSDSSSTRKSKVQTACKNGQYVSSGTNASKNLKNITYNYNVIPGGYAVLPGGFDKNGNYVSGTQLIASNSAKTRLNSDYSQNAWPITYKLVISASGLLNFSYSYNNGVYKPVLTNADITKSNGAIPSLFRFGFSAGTGGSNNVHEITCFSAVPLQSNSSAGANTVQSGQVRIGTQIYLASYSSDNWWGSLISAPVVTTGGVVSVSSNANWDAKCVLTGGGCPSMGTKADGTPVNTITAESPSNRVLMSWDDSANKGEAFQWASLNTSQTTALNSTDSAGSTRVSWLRGDRSTEQLQSPPGTLRARNGVLGDIINSSPTWVGSPTPGNYPDAFNDFLYGNPSSAPENASGAQSYSSFATTYGSRLNVVYVGANDGFLHGFSAGSYKTVSGTTTYDSTTNNGNEVLGFMPSGQLAKYAADLTSPTYAHDYVVDATPAVGDLFYNGKWHTWLVGGVGSAGSEIYALDITDPSTFKETNAATVVVGDWTSSALTHLGNTVGTPTIARLHNGKWAIIFGNGMGASTSAGIYIGLVDWDSTKSTATVTYQFLDTGVGSSSSPNGIAYVSTVDLDGDHVTDYVYAGDVQGNVWRFDLTDSSSSKWSVSNFGNTAATPLFVAKDAATTPNRQPITTAPVIASVQTGSTSRVMVLFGTGQKTPATTSGGDTYASGTQTFYGIWDWDMTAWNKASTIKYAGLAPTQSIARSTLLSQTSTQTASGASGQVLGYRSLPTGSQVCWSGSTTCAKNNTQFGWYYDLPDTQEQIIYNPVMVDGSVVVSTAEPPTISAVSCNPGLQTGWTMAFDPASGGGLKQGFFPDANGSYGSGSASTSVSGIRMDAVGSPTTIRYGGQTYIVTQTVKGTAALSKVNPQSGASPSRVSWREIKL